MKIKTLSTYLTLLLSLVTLFSSCEDRLDLSEYDVPEGEGELTLNFSFSDLVKTSIGGSRASGTAIESIDNVFIAIYNASGDKLMDYKYLTPDGVEDRYTGKLDVIDSENRPSDGIEKPDGNDPNSSMDWNKDQTTTPSASYTFEMFPFGRYQIYAAANVGNLVTNPDEKIREAVKTAKGLKSISYDWKPEDMRLNNQMFGYFTYADKQTSTGFDAPIVTVSTKVSELHAWIKRLASKVTIAYDPSGLKDNVTIYIHSVTLHDIPQSCFLGQQNPQWGDDDAQTQGVHPIALFNRKTVDDPNDGKIVDNSYFNYDRKGITTATGNTNELRGIKLANGYIGEAAVAENSVIQGSNHSSTADALYFYENIQGDYQGNSTFNKEMQPRGEIDGVGQIINKPGLNADGTPNDYKDKVPYGTYIEVDAYYDSKNPDNITSGHIIYRFMLGKNTTYNYDAARNHHYKLTLGFRGWANQPDWHIEYNEPDPVFYLPDTWYLSYLYNQRSLLPVKVSSNCKELKVEITQNHWSPYDDSNYDPNNWPPEDGEVIWPKSSTSTDVWAFKWAEDVVKGNGGTPLNGWATPQLGFLTLLVEGNDPDNMYTSIFGNGQEHGFGERDAAVTAAGNIYNNRKERTLSELDLDVKDERLLKTEYEYPGATNNNYWVQPVEDTEGGQDVTQKTVLIPLWTMPKDIIQNSGFSGNNPYEAYPRVANIHVTATYDLGDGKTTTKEGDCRLIQPERVTNPKGIWRKSGTSGSFHVVLMNRAGSNAHSNYKELVSNGSWTASISNISNAPNADGTPVEVNFISLSPGPFSKLDEETGEIKGASDSYVDFYVDFNGTDGCAVIDVKYNGENSTHKILVREGYENPVKMGGNTWSTFSFYGATARPGTTNEYDVVLTKNPLAMGSYVRRECVTKAILAGNNDRTGWTGNNKMQRYGPMGQLDNYRLWLALEDVEDRKMWSEIGSGININGTTYNYNGTDQTTGTSLGANGQDPVKYACSVLKGRSMGVFHGDNGLKYSVPTLADYKALDDECQYAFGILYGDAAAGTEKDWNKATSFNDYDNDDDTAESEKGVRGCIVYNPKNAEQIFFTLGQYGMGRRRQYGLTYSPNPVGNTYNGTLWYSDMNGPMNLTGNNWYRPVAYNVTIDPGAVYWIDELVEEHELGNNYPKEESFGWDINYMNLDFNAFSHNCVLDALPIKFIIKD